MLGVCAASRRVLLLDVMDTVVADPFFEHMPRFFGMSFQELLAAKHPDAWVRFERGVIDQVGGWWCCMTTDCGPR